VVGEDLLGVVLGGDAFEPGGELGVPDEVVAADLDFVLLGKGDESVGVVEEILVGLWLEGAELQGVFWDDEAVLSGEDAGEVVVVQVLGADGASGEKAVLVGVGLEEFLPSMLASEFVAD